MISFVTAPTRVRRGRRFPYGIPESWFHLAYSDEVPPGRSRTISAFGIELAMTRGEDGVLRVTGRLPHAAATFERPWLVCERNGLIFVYLGSRPLFEIPVIAECYTDNWVPVGRLDWTFRSHIQEVVENAVDLAHFQFLHRFTEHAQLVRFETEGPRYTATVSANKAVFGRRRPIALTINYHGMGFAVGRVTGTFPFLSLVTALPISDELVRQRLMLWVKAPRIPLIRHLIEPLVSWHIRRDVSEELTVLEYKRYLERPLLVAGDGPIMKVRRWCDQFYRPVEHTSACAHGLLVGHA